MLRKRRRRRRRKFVFVQQSWVGGVGGGGGGGGAAAAAFLRLPAAESRATSTTRSPADVQDERRAATRRFGRRRGRTRAFRHSRDGVISFSYFVSSKNIKEIPLIVTFLRLGHLLTPLPWGGRAAPTTSAMN